MASIFLRSTDGNDGNAGTQKEAAKATLAAALTAAGVGGTVYVSGSHAETAASAKTLTSPGTAASPVTVLCVADWGAATGTGVPTTLATTATVTTTGTNAINYNGFAYCYGITFSAGTGSGSAYHWWGSAGTAFHWIMEACAINVPGTQAVAVVYVYATNTGTTGKDTRLDLINTTMSFGSVSQYLAIHTRFTWRNTANAINGSIPTVLFSAVNPVAPADVTLLGVDFSALGSGKSLVSVTHTLASRYQFVDCKLGASVSLTTGTNPGQGGTIIDMVNCDSADTNYRYRKHGCAGDITSESTIVLTGGASDGTTAISRKMVSNANAKLYFPLMSDWITFWHDTPGSLTATIEVVTDGVTLTDAEAWGEVEYLGNGSYPIGSFANDRVASVLATAANQTSSSATWTTTGLGSPVTQKLDVTFTTAEKGLFRMRACLAKASTTMYFNPKINEFTSGRQYQHDGMYVEEGASGSGVARARLPGGLCAVG